MHNNKYNYITARDKQFVSCNMCKTLSWWSALTHLEYENLAIFVFVFTTCSVKFGVFRKEVKNTIKCNDYSFGKLVIIYVKSMLYCTSVVCFIAIAKSFWENIFAGHQESFLFATDTFVLNFWRGLYASSLVVVML